ncbi:MAG: type I restriction enzyme endonuclease domain-containing protein, partial [Oscillochloridaceae bacterium umkhey_bin13]
MTRFLPALTSLHADLQLRLLARLLEDDIARRRRQNVAQARSFKEMLDAAIRRASPPGRGSPPTRRERAWRGRTRSATSSGMRGSPATTPVP